MAKTILKLTVKEINDKVNDMAFFMYQSMGTNKELYIESLIEALITIQETKDSVSLRAGDKDKNPIHVIWEPELQSYVYFTAKGNKVTKHLAIKNIPIFTNA